MTARTTPPTEKAMNRQQFADRLRAWAARAENEVSYSLGTAQLTWQGQLEVLRATAAVVAGGTTPDALRHRIIADRQEALSAWQAETDPDEVAINAGRVQGYELVLELLQDAGHDWSV
jgi:hypothetical protein